MSCSCSKVYPLAPSVAIDIANLTLKGDITVFGLVESKKDCLNKSISKLPVETKYVIFWSGISTGSFLTLFIYNI